MTSTRRIGKPMQIKPAFAEAIWIRHGDREMIKSICGCGDVFALPEGQIGQPQTCGKCGVLRRTVAAEQIRDGEGSADFDARLEVSSGAQDGSGEQVFLGGVADVTFGKLPTHPLVLSAGPVSRKHGRLVRVDFGPSRWKIVDDGSTNGTFVNGQRLAGERELKDGDRIRVGGCELRYHVCDLYAPGSTTFKAAAAAVVGPGVDCPSCGKRHSLKAKICVDCGIDLKTGRAILTRNGVDENDVHIRTENVVSLIIWIFWTGLYPVASDASASGNVLWMTGATSCRSRSGQTCARRTRWRRTAPAGRRSARCCAGADRHGSAAPHRPRRGAPPPRYALPALRAAP